MVNINRMTHPFMWRLERHSSLTQTIFCINKDCKQLDEQIPPSIDPDGCIRPALYKCEIKSCGGLHNKNLLPEYFFCEEQLIRCNGCDGEMAILE